MRKLTILIIFVLMTSVALAQESPKTAPAQSDAEKKAANIIVGTEQQAWEAMKNKDAKFFEANLAADSSMIGYIGVLNKTAAINLIARCLVRPSPIRLPISRSRFSRPRRRW